MSELLTVDDVTVDNVRQFLNRAYALYSGESIDDDELEDYYGDNALFELDYYATKPIQVGNLTLKCIEEIGGGEGSGSDHHIIFSVSDCNKIKYFRAQGYYASYVGTTWEDIYEVQPRQEEVTVYE